MLTSVEDRQQHRVGPEGTDEKVDNKGSLQGRTSENTVFMLLALPGVNPKLRTEAVINK